MEFLGTNNLQLEWRSTYAVNSDPNKARLRILYSLRLERSLIYDVR